MTMFWWLFLHVLLAFASTCTGKEIGPQCEPNRVLEQDEMHLYAIEGTETSVLPISRNNTDVRWAVPGKYSKSVTNRYRRLVIPDISQFAGGYAMYRLVKDKETVYISARVYAHIGKLPVLTDNIPNVVTIQYGDSYRFCFQYSGIPEPVLIPYKLDSGPMALRISNSCLEIQFAVHSDAGYYILEAKNCFGSKLVDFRIKVLEKPSFLFHNATGDLLAYPVPERSSYSIKMNGNLVLSYSVGGSPKPQVEWFHNDSVLDGSKYNESHLMLHDVKPSDAGTYMVVAHSAYGRINETFWFFVGVTTPSSEPPPTKALVETSQSSNGGIPHSDSAAILFTTDSPKTSVTANPVSCDKGNSCDDTSEFPWWVVGVTVCLVTVIGLLIIVIVVICCCKRKRNNTDPEKSETLKDSLKLKGSPGEEVVTSDSTSNIKIVFEAVVVEQEDDNYDHIVPESLYSTLSAKDEVVQNRDTGSPLPLYSCVSKDNKKQAAYSDYTTIEKLKEQGRTLRYADLDKDALEEASPARPRYDAVEYTDINAIQPGPRQG